MDGIFTLPYSEYEVINILQNKITKKDGNSFYIPTSRQQKGIDFIIHNYKSEKLLKVQVKGSRSYSELPKKLKSGIIKDVKYKYHLWFSNFRSRYKKGNADLYLLFGLYPVYTQDKNIKSKLEFWQPIVLCFLEDEMFTVLENAKTKKKQEPEKFFGFAFNTKEKIFGTRGFPTDTDMSQYLLKNRIDDIKKLISK